MREETRARGHIESGTRITRRMPPLSSRTYDGGEFKNSSDVVFTRTMPCEELASENFYDTPAAFMSRVNLANSASFTSHWKHLGLSSFLVSLAAENAVPTRIKPARNDVVPQPFVPPRTNAVIRLP